jgi:hypothetical protein
MEQPRRIEISGNESPIFEHILHLEEWFCGKRYQYSSIQITDLVTTRIVYYCSITINKATILERSKILGF